MGISLKHAWGACALSIFSVACSPQQIGFAGGESGAIPQQTSAFHPTPTCGNLATTKVTTKMLFITDMSDSNEITQGCELSEGCSDPGKHVRAGSIQKFFSDYGQLPNFKWGFQTFQETWATSLVNGFGSAADMQNAINTFVATPDWGQTPYITALDLAQTTVSSDPDLNSPTDTPQYLIVFMSDGAPSDTADGALLAAKVKALKDLSPGNVTFNTVYYGPDKVNEPALLKSMADAGDGHFLDTNADPAGLSFAIKDFINVPCP